MPPAPDARYPEAGLLPRADGTLAATQARAQVLRWCDFASTALYLAHADFYNYGLGDADKRIPRAAEAAAAQAHPRHRGWKACLPGSHF